MNQKKSKKKLSSGTKENITRVINDLSMIIGRKSPPKENTLESLNQIYDVTDLHISALALILPDIDQQWINTGARTSFLQLKKTRRQKYRLFFGLAIVSVIILLLSSIMAIIFLDHWSKWLILGFSILLIFLGTVLLPQSVIMPKLLNFDLSVPNKYNSECSQIDQFIKYLLSLSLK